MTKKKKKEHKQKVARRREKLAKARRDMRILWCSNAPWVNSGYGVFTREILRLMRNDGWPLACVAFAGLESGLLDWEGIRCYPKMSEAYGGDALYLHGKDWGAHVHFTMQDTPTLNSSYLAQIPVWIPYTPVHYSPAEPFVTQQLNYAYKILTFAEFGRKGLADKGYSSTMIPEGVKTDIFYPMNKKEIREKMKIPQDMFLFGMVGANKEIPTRKGFQEALDAFKLFADKHPNAGLYIHTFENPIGAFPIKRYANEIGIGDKVFLPDNYNVAIHSDHSVINQVMNVFDCLLQPSRTEGFGLSSIEAQACGIPVIVTNFSAMPELIVDGKTGLLVDVQKYEYSAQFGYWAVPDMQSLYTQMEKIFEMLTKDDGTIAKDCRQHILDNFDLDKIYIKYWRPMLEALQNDLLPIDNKKE